MEQLSKHVSVKTNLHNDKRAVFCVVKAKGLYKEQRRSFESVEFRDASLPGYELGSRGIELKN
jgi:hypothetical protein